MYIDMIYVMQFYNIVYMFSVVLLLDLVEQLVNTVSDFQYCKYILKHEAGASVKIGFRCLNIMLDNNARTFIYCNLDRF